jgi:hypothetical protein
VEDKGWRRNIVLSFTCKDLATLRPHFAEKVENVSLIYITVRIQGSEIGCDSLGCGVMIMWSRPFVEFPV